MKGKEKAVERDGKAVKRQWKGSVSKCLTTSIVTDTIGVRGDAARPMVQPTHVKVWKDPRSPMFRASRANGTQLQRLMGCRGA